MTSRTLSLAAVLVLSLAVRLWFVREAHPPELYVMHDMALYERGALRLLAGLAQPEDTFNPVGYPAFVALVYLVFGPSPAAVGVLQAFLGAATCGLVHALARRTCGGAWAALLAALACAFYFPLIFYAGLLLTETLFALLATAGVLLWIRALERPGRAARWLAAGLGLGLATTVRTNLVVVVPFLLLAAWPTFRQRTWPRTHALFAALGLTVVLVFVSARNSAILGRPAGLSTNAGLNFFLGQARVQSVRFPDGDVIAKGSVAHGRRHYTTELRTEHHAWDDGYFFRLGLKALSEHPERLVDASNLREGLGLVRPLPWPEQPFWPGWSGHDRAMAVSSLVFPIVVLPGAALAWALGPSRRRARKTRGALLAVFAGVLLTMHVLKGDARVRVSFEPVIFPLAAAGWERAGRRTLRRARAIVSTVAAIQREADARAVERG